MSLTDSVGGHTLFSRRYPSTTSTGIFLIFGDLARWLKQDPDELREVLVGGISKGKTSRYLFLRAFGVGGCLLGANKDRSFCLQGIFGLLTRSECVELTGTDTNPLYL